MEQRPPGVPGFDGFIPSLGGSIRHLTEVMRSGTPRS